MTDKADELKEMIVKEKSAVPNRAGATPVESMANHLRKLEDNHKKSEWEKAALEIIEAETFDGFNADEKSFFLFFVEWADFSNERIHIFIKTWRAHHIKPDNSKIRYTAPDGKFRVIKLCRDLDESSKITSDDLIGDYKDRNKAEKVALKFNSKKDHAVRSSAMIVLNDSGQCIVDSDDGYEFSFEAGKAHKTL